MKKPGWFWGIFRLGLALEGCSIFTKYGELVGHGYRYWSFGLKIVARGLCRFLLLEAKS